MSQLAIKRPLLARKCHAAVQAKIGRKAICLWEQEKCGWERSVLKLQKVYVRCKFIVYIKTREAIVVKRINKHNHSGNGARVEMPSARNKTKKSTITQKTTTAVITWARARLSTAAKGQISKLKSWKKLLQRQLHVAGQAPPAPDTLHIISVAVDYFFISDTMVCLNDLAVNCWQ